MLFNDNNYKNWSANTKVKEKIQYMAFIKIKDGFYS